MHIKGKRIVSKNKRFVYQHKQFRVLVFLFISCFYIFIHQVQVHAAVPSPWLDQDIGSASNGSADYANNQFTVSGSGIDIGSLSDTFHFVYQPYSGDVEIVSKVESIGNIDPMAKAGVMVRETLTNKSKNVLMTLTSGSTSFLTRRTLTNGSTATTTGTSVRAPYWVKLVRRGNNFYGYQSPDGSVWTQIGSAVSVTMTANVYVGLAANSSKAATYNTSVFSNVSVRPATPPSAPVLNTATAGVGQVDLTWNMVDRATSYKVKYGTASGSYTNTLALGNVAQTSVTGLNNGTAYYFVVTAVNEYGESVVSNQLSATPLDPPTVFIKKIDYNAMGQKTRIEYGNGVVTTNTYDPLNLRLKRIYTVNSTGTVLQDLNYAYDSAGNILSITDAINTSSQTFKYDELNRLTQANGSYGTKNYQYDQIGNIVQKDGKIYSYAEGGAGIHAVTSLSDGTTMTYDANGNMTSKQKGSELVLFGYDAENRLVEVKKNGVVTASYQYDGDGGRVKKTVGSTVTKYVGSLYEETNGVKTRHIFIGDMKVASVTGAQMMYYHSDHLGGTNVLTDKSGIKKELMEYEPFGMFARHDKYGTNAEVANFYFTGQRFDEESGLYYYNARYYDPGLGRFISADSMVQSPSGNPQTLNRYLYCGNNPINFTDSSGHWFFAAIFAAIKGIAAAAIAHPVISGALVGAASSGIQSYQATGSVNPLSVGLGSLQGGLSGWTLGLSTASAAKMGIGSGLSILKASAAASLASQIASATGAGNVSQIFQYASMGLAGVYTAWNIGIGIKNWIHEPQFETYDTFWGEAVYPQSGDSVHVNGILTPFDEAMSEAGGAGANVLAYNPTHGAIADLTESLLSKVFFTGSIERQLAGNLNGLTGISLSGFSQGGIIASNTTLGLGLRGQRNLISQLKVGSSQISQIRAAVSGAVGGGLTWQKTVIYSTGSPFDFSNALGPNIGPSFFGGVIGLSVLPVGIANHKWPY